MGLKDDNAVNKPVTKVYQCTDDLGQAAVSKAAVDDDAVQVPSEAAVDDDAVQVPSIKKKSVLSSWYALGCAAVSKIDKSVRKDGVKQKLKKLKKYLPGSESREKIVQALTHPATQEALKLVVPGVAEAANYLAESVLLGTNQILNLNLNQNQNENDIDEQNKYEHVIEQLKVLQAENEKMQKQINNLVMTTTNNSSSSSTVLSEQKPEEQKSEEVITESMTSS